MAITFVFDLVPPGYDIFWTILTSEISVWLSNYYFFDIAVAGIHCILRRFGLAYISTLTGGRTKGNLVWLLVLSTVQVLLAIEAWTSSQLRFHFGTATAIIMSACVLHSGELLVCI